MGLTRVSGDILQTPLNVGVVTATGLNVGSAVTIHTGGFQVGTTDIHSSGATLHNINSTGVITATSFSGNVFGNVTGNINSTGVSTFTTLRVGTAVTISSGIVSATSFYGDGTNLTNTGSTLSAASGSQRVVLTGQTSGTMTASATDSALTYAQSTGTLSATKFSGDGSALTGIAGTENVRTNSLVVSGVSTFAVGSASTPAISQVGYNTTGIFFPDANTIAFSNGGAETWRIGGSAYNYTNLTNSGTFFDDYKPALSSYRSSGGSTSSETFDSTINNSFWDNKTLTYNKVIRTIHSYNPSATNRAIVGLYSFLFNNGSGANNFPTGGSGTSYWTPNGCAIWGEGSIGSVGNVGHASIRADIQSYYFSGAAFYARVWNGVTSGVGYGLHVDLGGHPFGNRQVGVYVRQMDNQTMTGNAGYVYKRHNTSGTFWVLQVENGAGSTIGGITCTNTNTAFPTSSDYRLKENIVPLIGAVERIKQIPVHRFNFIESPEITQDGFLAHELQPVVPIAVDGEKDEVETLPKKDENGEFIYNGEGDERTPVFETVPKYQTVDYSKVVPLLTAALQEAVAEIETLKARLDAAGL